MSTDLTVGLPELARGINREYQLAQTSAYNAITHAMRCGQNLIDAKSLLDHGQWQSWLRDHFPDSERTANNYMKLAANPQHAADLDQATSIRQGLKLVAAAEQKTTTKQVAEQLRHDQEIIVDATIVELLPSHRGWACETKILDVTNLIEQAHTLNENAAATNLREALRLTRLIISDLNDLLRDLP